MLLRTGSRAWHVTLPGWSQAALVTASLGMVGAMGYLTVGYFSAHHLIREKEAEVALAEMSKADAGALVSDLRRRLAAARARHAAVSAQYEEARSQLAVATAQNGALRGSLDLAQSHAKSAEKARAALERQLRSAERMLAPKAVSLASAVEEDRPETYPAIKRTEALAPAAIIRRKPLLHLAAAHTRHPPLPARKPQIAERLADAPQSGSSAGPASARTAEAAHERPGKLERLIASTGIDIDKLLGRLGSLPAGQGGPYVALDDARKAEPPQREQQRIKELRKLVKALPLAAPLVHYHLESGFGARKDPFRGRRSFHSGLDLSAPYKTPVYSTAPGVVAFTGVRSGYGRVVEIDHGHGIVTRYAHLHRILVARGQKVGLHTEIGQLGSTGRSTGPHVHYEILVDGVPQDPEGFIEAGRNVIQISKK